MGWCIWWGLWREKATIDQEVPKQASEESCTIRQFNRLQSWQDS